MSAPINIDLDQQIFPRNFVAHFSQSSPGRTRPERCELLLAQFDLAFFAMAASTDLKCEGRTVPRLSQANLSSGRLSRQITLLDHKASRLLQIFRQPFDQEFSFNFAIFYAFSVEIFALAKMERVVLNAFATACRFAA